MMQPTPLRMFFHIFSCLLVSATSLFASSDQSKPSASPISSVGTANAVDTLNASQENIVDTGNGSPSVGSTRSGGENRGKNKTVEAQSVDQKKTAAAPPLSMEPQMFHYDTSLQRRDSLQRELFNSLGNYHRLMGIYGVIGGALTILAGAMLLDRENSEPFAMSFMVIGGISVGLGLWEIRIGAPLSSYKVSSK